MEPVKKYYSLTKPRVLYGNVMTTVAGFLLASEWHISFGLFAAVIAGTTLVIASACALNNYFDRDIDSIMERTKNRVIASGEVKGRNAVIFGTVIGIAGMLILYFYVNTLVVVIGLAGFITYVLFYGILAKRLSVHGTLVGSISGAMPVLAGYCAARGRLDAGAVFVFLTLFFWQLPEFYSISIYRHDEYKAAGVPVMSVVKGVKHTKAQIFIYTFAFVVSSLMLTVLGYTGYTYFVVMGLLGAYWLRLGFDGLKTKNNDKWARQMFHFSLIILLALSVMLSVGSVLP